MKYHISNFTSLCLCNNIYFKAFKDPQEASHQYSFCTGCGARGYQSEGEQSEALTTPPPEHHCHNATSSSRDALLPAICYPHPPPPTPLLFLLLGDVWYWASAHWHKYFGGFNNLMRFSSSPFSGYTNSFHQFTVSKNLQLPAIVRLFVMACGREPPKWCTSIFKIFSGHLFMK